jgi:hypothetical protein
MYGLYSKLRINLLCVCRSDFFSPKEEDVRLNRKTDFPMVSLSTEGSDSLCIYGRLSPLPAAALTS